ncbi:MAG: D-alanine--D-alanine ligase A [Flavobacteriales bacterium]|jgi:D-alanine-D-alanine ligase|nr:D-alanine--D-alanine ligase A [Flavobacteriales bacterium]|tara:strand:+ start:1351 stop:2289 length:939 start_codon:yes stop_codon:yes gene_type:complete
MENIAIVTGGTSNEKNISLKSAATILKNIDKKKYNAYKVLCIDINNFQVIIEDNVYCIDNNDFTFNYKNEKIKFEKAYVIIHGNPGENGKLCSYFESKNIPYTSCNEKISKLTFNKFKCNNLLRSLGYDVPDAQIYTDKCTTQFPCIVKPSSSGSSYGISKVYDADELKIAVDKALKHDKEIIIEQFIKGREVTCAVFNFHKKIETLPITEIVSENDIFDYDAKYNGKSIEKTPANIKNNIKNNINNIAKNIYKDLELKGIIRIDFIISNTTPYLIEINTIPGFSEESIVPQMLKCAKINLKDFITAQIKNA